MLTTGSKWFFGLGTLGAVAALVYGWGGTGGATGVLTVGLTGGVGEHSGFTVLLVLSVTAIFIGTTVIAFRDADPEALAAVARVEQVPEVPAVRNRSYWPALGAIAAALVVVGLVSGAGFVVLGLIIAGVVLLEWMVTAWSDRATGDPEVNRRIRNRMMAPIEIPVLAALGIFVLVLSVSRVLLALSTNGASIAAIVFATLLLVGAFVIAAAPRAGKPILGTVFALAALGVIAAGVIAAAEGSRTFEEHHEEEREFSPPDRRQPGVGVEVDDEAPADVGSDDESPAED